MKYYGVTTKFFDDGTVRAFVYEVEADEMPKSTFEELKTCDIYHDFFNTLHEAEDFRDDAYRA